MSLAKIGNKIFDKEVKLSAWQEKVLELSSGAVDLGIVDDIAKWTDALGETLGEANTELKKVEVVTKALVKAEAAALKVKKSRDTKVKKYDKTAKMALKISNKAKKAAKELGVNPSNIKGLAKMEDLISKVEKISDDIWSYDMNLEE